MWAGTFWLFNGQCNVPTTARRVVVYDFVLKGKSMKLLKSLRWAAIALGVLGGSVNALACTVTPDTILSEGQTVQLTADCGTDLIQTINWKMAVGTAAAASLTGDITLAQSVPKKINFTIPVGLASSGNSYYSFSISGTYGNGDPITTANVARVVVKPVSVAVNAVQNTSTPVNGMCGVNPGAALQSIPASSAQCSAGAPALAISGPSSFSWSCLGLNGGSEANCYGVRGFTVTAAVNGGNGTVSIDNGAVVSGGTATITALPADNYSVDTISGCGAGTRFGNSYTTAPVTADNCLVTATFVLTPVNSNGVCATIAASTTQPSSGSMCSSVTAASNIITTNPNTWNWTCQGTGSGSSPSCSSPKAYTITASLTGNGSISPVGTTNVNGGSTREFIVQPGTGNVAVMGGSCGGNLSNTTYTTNPIVTNCNVTATFSEQTVSTTDTGSGLWMPPGMNNRLIADQTGTSTTVTSFLPGCLNGANTINGSNTGCGANTTYPVPASINGTASETNFGFGSGNTLGLRYQSKSNANASFKYFQINSADGGNLGHAMKIWLTTNPTESYDAANAACKSTSTTSGYIFTGPGRCQIAPNTRYYLLMSVDVAVNGLRYRVDESQADFN